MLLPPALPPTLAPRAPAAFGSNPLEAPWPAHPPACPFKFPRRGLCTPSVLHHIATPLLLAPALACRTQARASYALPHSSWIDTARPTARVVHRAHCCCYERPSAWPVASPHKSAGAPALLLNRRAIGTATVLPKLCTAHTLLPQTWNQAHAFAAPAHGFLSVLPGPALRNRRAAPAAAGPPSVPDEHSRRSQGRPLPPIAGPAPPSTSAGAPLPRPPAPNP